MRPQDPCKGQQELARGVGGSVLNPPRHTVGAEFKILVDYHLCTLLLLRIKRTHEKLDSI